MSILAVIPARGGSKSVPRKNIALIGGRPLLAYTIDAARDAARAVPALTDIVVSTDDEEIARVASELGAQVPFLRPADLASDQAQSAPVLKHALLFLEKARGQRYDAVLMLQPTTPLRRAEHIEAAIRLFESEPCDSVVSVVAVGGHHPFRMKRMIGTTLINFIDQGFEDMRPRQVLPPVYIRNGAIYLTRRTVVADQGAIVGPHCLGLEMNDVESVNIDTRLDFLVAQALIEQGAAR